jgi:hypothetical protein
MADKTPTGEPGDGKPNPKALPPEVLEEIGSLWLAEKTIDEIAELTRQEPATVQWHLDMTIKPAWEKKGLESEEIQQSDEMLRLATEWLRTDKRKRTAKLLETTKVEIKKKAPERMCVDEIVDALTLSDDRGWSRLTSAVFEFQKTVERELFVEFLRKQMQVRQGLGQGDFSN